MTTREALHQIIDEIPEGELHTAQRFLEYLRSLRPRRLPRALAEAPEDDEPETEEEAEGMAEAYEDIRQGNLYPLEQVKRELGL